MRQASLLLLPLLFILSVSCSKHEPSIDQNIRTLNGLSEELRTKTDAELKAKGCSIDTSNASGWMLETCTSKMDGTKSVTVSKSSVYARCSTHETEAFVSVNTQIQPEFGSEFHRVRVKVDNGKPSLQHWSESTSGDVLFSPSARQFIGQLAHAHTLYFEYTPFQERERVLELDVSGLDQFMPLLSDSCGWKQDDARQARVAASERAEALKRDAEHKELCKHLEFKCESTGNDANCAAWHVQCD